MKSKTRKNNLLKNVTERLGSQSDAQLKKDFSKSLNSKEVQKSMKNQGLKVDNRNLFIQKCVEKTREIARIFKKLSKSFSKNK